MKNSFEITPVHMVCLSWAPYEVFSTVVLQNKDTIFTSAHTTKENRSPIDYLCWIHQMEIMQGLRMSREEVTVTLHSSVDSDFKMFWKKLSLLLMVANKHSASSQLERKLKKQSIVHAIVSLKKCPIDALRLAVKLYPEELEFLNEDQKLPLQVAIENGRSMEEIQILLDAYPLAASIAMGNCRVYPFVLAAVKGHEIATLFCLLQLCPELERFCIETTGRRLHETTDSKQKIQMEVSSLYNEFGDGNALKNIDCTEFDAALQSKKIRVR